MVGGMEWNGMVALEGETFLPLYKILISFLFSIGNDGIFEVTLKRKVSAPKGIRLSFFPIHFLIHYSRSTTTNKKYENNKF